MYAVTACDRPDKPSASYLVTSNYLTLSADGVGDPSLTVIETNYDFAFADATGLVYAAVDADGNTSELSNCAYDLDGDALNDVWEESGADLDRDGVVDVPLDEMGANPKRPDTVVEVHATGSQALDDEALDRVREAFRDAPVRNPLDGNTGVQLHIDNGPDSEMSGSPMEGHTDWPNLFYYGGSIGQGRYETPPDEIVPSEPMPANLVLEAAKVLQQGGRPPVIRLRGPRRGKGQARFTLTVRSQLPLGGITTMVDEQLVQVPVPKPLRTPRKHTRTGLGYRSRLRFAVQGASTRAVSAFVTDRRYCLIYRTQADPIAVRLRDGQGSPVALSGSWSRRPAQRAPRALGMSSPHAAASSASAPPCVRQSAALRRSRTSRKCPASIAVRSGSVTRTGHRASGPATRLRGSGGLGVFVPFERDGG